MLQIVAWLPELSLSTQIRNPFSLGASPLLHNQLHHCRRKHLDVSIELGPKCTQSRISQSRCMKHTFLPSQQRQHCLLLESHEIGFRCQAQLLHSFSTGPFLIARGVLCQCCRCRQHFLTIVINLKIKPLRALAASTDQEWQSVIRSFKPCQQKHKCQAAWDSFELGAVQHAQHRNQ